MDEKLKEQIDVDGYGHESRVRQKLEDLGWSVQPGETYLDIAKKVDREIDLLAEKIYPRSDYDGGNIGIRLVIECKWKKTKAKNLPNDVAINTESRNTSEIIKLIAKEFDLDDPRDFDISKHHYLDSGIHLASHTTPNNGYFYEAVEQVVHAFHYFKLKRRMENVGKFFQFPVVVTDGPGKVYLRESNVEHLKRYQYYHPYDVDGVRFPHYIDVVPFGLLEEYVEVLDEDFAVYKRTEDFKPRVNSFRQPPYESSGYYEPF
jgi:hypothetical protein